MQSFGRGLAFVVLTVTLSQRLVAAEEISLIDIRIALERYSREIKTLTGRQRITSLQPKPKVLQRDARFREDMIAETDFKVDLVHRRTWLDETDTWYERIVSNDPFVLGRIQSSDGDKGYMLYRSFKQLPIPTNVPSNVPYVLEIRQDHGDESLKLAIRMAGLPIGSLRVSLAEALRSPEAKITGRRTIDQHPCIDVTTIVDSWRVDVSLDPAVSFLPRRLAISEAGDSSRRSREQTNSEFRQFPVEGSNESFWFPVRGRESGHGSPHELELLDLTINPPLSQADFQIDSESLQPGVLVVTRNITSRTTTVTGDRQDLRAELKQKLDQQEADIAAAVDQAYRTYESAKTTTVEPAADSTLRATVWIAATIGLVILGVLIMSVQRLRTG